MARDDRPTVQIQPETAKDFGGMSPEVGPDSLPLGASRLQVNVAADRPGVLSPRLGYRVVIFDDRG